MLSLKTALCWLQGGAPDKSVPILLDLKRRAGGERLRLGGRSVALFDRNEDALPWLKKLLGSATPAAPVPTEGWPIFGGAPDRNAEASPASPWNNRSGRRL